MPSVISKLTSIGYFHRPVKADTGSQVLCATEAIAWAAAAKPSEARRKQQQKMLANAHSHPGEPSPLARNSVLHAHVHADDAKAVTPTKALNGGVNSSVGSGSRDRRLTSGFVKAHDRVLGRNQAHQEQRGVEQAQVLEQEQLEEVEETLKVVIKAKPPPHRDSLGIHQNVISRKREAMMSTFPMTGVPQCDFKGRPGSLIRFANAMPVIRRGENSGCQNENDKYVAQEDENNDDDENARGAEQEVTCSTSTFLPNLPQAQPVSATDPATVFANVPSGTCHPHSGVDQREGWVSCSTVEFEDYEWRVEPADEEQKIEEDYDIDGKDECPITDLHVGLTTGSFSRKGNLVANSDTPSTATSTLSSGSFSFLSHISVWTNHIFPFERMTSPGPFDEVKRDARGKRLHPCDVWHRNYLIGVEMLWWCGLDKKINVELGPVDPEALHMVLCFLEDLTATNVDAANNSIARNLSDTLQLRSIHKRLISRIDYPTLKHTMSLLEDSLHWDLYITRYETHVQKRMQYLRSVAVCKPWLPDEEMLDVGFGTMGYPVCKDCAPVYGPLGFISWFMVDVEADDLYKDDELDNAGLLVCHSRKKKAAVPPHVVLR